MKKIKYAIMCGLAAVLAVGLFFMPRQTVTASANSAPHFWEGTSSIGVLGQDDCPLTVEHELLTFTVNTFPDDRGSLPEDYDARVTAAYTFYNPTDEDITAVLDFPLGDTWYNNDETDFTAVSMQYDITVDGAVVEKKLRYTPYEGWNFDAVQAIDDLSDQLPDAEYVMLWYEYSMTVPAQARVENTVTAPLYPGGNFGYTPTIYQYVYLLSPAQNWAAFGSLDIVIETPYYCTQSGFGRGYYMSMLDTEVDFEQTETGYSLHLDGLPDGELTFTLCASPDPKVVRDYGKAIGYSLLFIFYLPLWLYGRLFDVVVNNPLSVLGIAAVVLVVVLLFVAILAVVQSRQKKNAKHYVLRKKDDNQQP